MFPCSLNTLLGISDELKLLNCPSKNCQSCKKAATLKCSRCSILYCDKVSVCILISIKNAAEETGFRIARCVTGKSTRTSALLSNRLLNGEDAIGANLISIGCEIKYCYYH